MRSNFRNIPLEMLTVVDKYTVAITYPDFPVFMSLDDSKGQSILIADEQAIRSLRAACDAALGEGEEK
jgi:hypothetical protein